METTFKNGKQLLEALLADPHTTVHDLTILEEDMRVIVNDLRADRYSVSAFENTGYGFETCDVCEYKRQTYIKLNTETNHISIAYI